MFNRKKIQLYFGDAPARFALVAAVASDHEVIDLGPLREIFDLSLEMVDDDKSSGFNLLSELLDPYWCLAMNDLLEDPQGEFFIDDNQYADIALHMVKYMSANLEHVPSAGYPDLVINVALQIIFTLQSFSNTSHYGQGLFKYPG
jgi:hypothetical protein